MSIKIFILGALSITTKGQQVFEVNGQTVGECLNHLVSLVPKIQDVLFYEARAGLTLRSRIHVQVNNEIVDVEGLAKEVKAGDEIQIKKILQ